MSPKARVFDVTQLVTLLWKIVEIQWKKPSLKLLPVRYLVIAVRNVIDPTLSNKQTHL